MRSEQAFFKPQDTYIMSKKDVCVLLCVIVHLSFAFGLSLLTRTRKNVQTQEQHSKREGNIYTHRVFVQTRETENENAPSEDKRISRVRDAVEISSFFLWFVSSRVNIISIGYYTHKKT